MRNIIICLLPALLLISCASHRGKQNESVQDTGTFPPVSAELFDRIDSVCRWFESEEEMYEDQRKETVDSAILAWNKLKNACTHGRYREAKEIMTDFNGDLLVYTRNTTAQYLYIEKIKRPVLEAVDENFARTEILSDLELCMLMTEAIIEIRAYDNEEEIHLPPHYKDLIENYFSRLIRSGEYEKAGELPDKLKRYFIMDGMPEKIAEASCRIMKTRLSCFRDDKQTALKNMDDLYKMMKDDPDLTEWADTFRNAILKLLETM